MTHVTLVSRPHGRGTPVACNAHPVRNFRSEKAKRKQRTTNQLHVMATYIIIFRRLEIAWTAISLSAADQNARRRFECLGRGPDVMHWKRPVRCGETAAPARPVINDVDAESGLH